MMLAIKNANIVLENETINNGILLIEDGKILNFGGSAEIEIPDYADVVDANGDYVGPGFVDIHNHGGGGYLFNENPVEASNFFLKYGTTTVLPTYYTSMSSADFIEAIDKTLSAVQSGEIKNFGGFYMEGPYTNVKYGATPSKNFWRGEIKASEYLPIIERGGVNIRVWAMAPEREGIEPFLQKAIEGNPNVTISVAHSEATPAQIEKFKKYNIRLLTHCMDATGRIPCPAGTRSCGPDEACFLDDDMYAEVICDSQGIHVNPDMIKLILKVKTKDKIVLVSDSFVSDEQSPEQLAHIKDLNFDPNGDLCGSRLTLNVACKNMIKHTGVSINDVFVMASRNPSQVIGLDKEIGTIQIGKKANLIIVDDNFDVKKVIIEGEVIC